MTEAQTGSGARAGSTGAFVSRFLEGLDDGAAVPEPEAADVQQDAEADPGSGPGQAPGKGGEAAASTDGAEAARGDSETNEETPFSEGSDDRSVEPGAAEGEGDTQTVTVTVGGETREVGLDELRAGYQRLAALSQAMQAQQAAPADAGHGTQTLEGLKDQLARQAGIRSAEEIQKLHDEGHYSDWVVAREQRRDFEERFEAQLQSSRQAMAAAQLQAVNHCWQRVPELLPAWRDLESAGAEIRDVGRYLVEQGVPAGQVPLISNPLVWPIARKAMLYDRLQAQKPAITKRVAEAPRMQKAGPGRSRKSEEGERYAAERQRLKKSGKVEDAARLFRRIV